MDVEALVARYDEIDQEREEELIAHLLQHGWEARCWIRPHSDQIIMATQLEIEELLSRLRSRSGFIRASIDDPFPNGRDHEPIDGKESCYVLLTQRCDVVGLLKAEPLIELAPAAFCTRRDRIANAWKNSPREFPVDPRGDRTHVIDLRYRYFISKLDLVDLLAKQALPRDTPEYQVRLRFGLRAAQRYTRAAVPDRLVSLVMEPLRKLVVADPEATKLFSEWALFHGDRRDAKPGVLAIYQARIDDALTDDEQAAEEDKIREAAEDTFHAIMDALPQTAKDELAQEDGHRTRVVDERDLTVADWRLSWKLEWDAESFGGQADAAIPAR